MDDLIGRQIQKLSRSTIPVLRIKYREVFGQQAKVAHKQYLVRRIAWQLQAQAEGDLSEPARRRIAEIADESDLSRQASLGLRAKPTAGDDPVHTVGSGLRRDPRVPPIGTLLRRRHQGREIIVKVLESSFEYDSQCYGSLSAIARQVTGTRWNGLLFFGLTERRHE
jgi:hypothetical protein